MHNTWKRALTAAAAGVGGRQIYERTIKRLITIGSDFAILTPRFAHFERVLSLWRPASRV